MHNGYFVYTNSCHTVCIIPLDKPSKEIQISDDYTSHCTAFCTADGELFSGNDSYTLCIHDLSSSLKATVKGHTNNISHIEKLGDYIFTNAEDNSIRVWNRKTLKQEYSLCYDSQHNGIFTVYEDSVFCYDYHDGVIYEFNYKSGELIRGFVIGANQFFTVRCLEVNKHFLVSSTPRELRIWCRKKAEVLHKLSYNIEALSITDTHAVIGTTRGEIILLELATGKQIKAFKEHTKQVVAIWMKKFPEKVSIYSAGGDGKLIQIDIPLEDKLRVCEFCKAEKVQGVKFKRCGACLSVYYCSRECQVRICNAGV